MKSLFHESPNNVGQMTDTHDDDLTIRVQRVGVFNFRTDRVRVLEKTLGSGSGMDRVRVLAPHFLAIGYYRVLKILIGYFSVTSLIRYFCLVQLKS